MSVGPATMRPVPGPTQAVSGVGLDFLFAAEPFTGLEHHALHILRGLHEAGTSVDVWVPDRLVSKIGEAVQGHRVVPFPSVPRPLRLGHEQWAIPWRFGAHPSSYRLVHSIIGVAPLLMTVPLVLTVPDLTYRMAPRELHPRARLYFGLLVPLSIRRARRIIVSAEAIRKEVIDQYHIAPERVVSVPLCADPTFRPLPPEQVVAIRKQFGLPERYILYVGTIDARKDLRRLRNAYDLLPPDLADSALVFVGRTAHGQERLARELRRPGKRGHVISIGYVPRDLLPAIYGGASVFVYPSRYEGFGLPVLEAMSCGTPVIVSNTGALRELVRDAGIVLETDSAEELTRAMERLLRFEEERRQYQQLGADRASAFSARRLGVETAGVYLQALPA